jgi:ankyrin repeat protein
MEPNTRDERGFTPLMIAILHKHREVVDVLMEDRRVEYHKTLSASSLDLATVVGLGEQVQAAIDRRKIEEQRWLARLFLNRRRETMPQLPADIVQHQINDNLVHEKKES